MATTTPTQASIIPALLAAVATALPAPLAAAIAIEPVAAGLRHPWSLAFLPDGDFLVTEKEGGLVRVGADGRQAAISGLPAGIDTLRRVPDDHSGLFDVVLDPRFIENRRLYFTYASRVDEATTTRLVRAELHGDVLAAVTPLFDATPRSVARHHYGGGLLLSREELLYLTVGDRHLSERDNPPLPVAQDPRDRRGKVYRFTLDGVPAPGNPDFGPEALPGLYAVGIRAAQGLAEDPDSGRIWMSEHGPVSGDEINPLLSGGNYGWPGETRGRHHDVDARRLRRLHGPPLVAPAWTWADRVVAPAGIAVYTGHAFPDWYGDLLVAGLGSGSLLRMEIDGDAVADVETLWTGTRLRNVKQSPDGTLYVLTDESDGRLLRIVASPEHEPNGLATGD